MKNELIIAKNIKEFIYSIDSIIDNYPKKYYELRNNIMNTSFKLLEFVYCSNYKKDYLDKIFSLISMLDFYLEISFKKKIINEKKLCNFSNELLVINKMVYKWYES